MSKLVNGPTLGPFVVSGLAFENGFGFFPTLVGDVGKRPSAVQKPPPSLTRHLAGPGAAPIPEAGPAGRNYSAKKVRCNVTGE